MGITKGKIFTITSVKGGTGKTTTTLNLAGIFSLMKQKVLVIDFDLYSGGIAASLNVDIKTDVYRLVDDISNNRFDFIDNYTLNYAENIDILPAPKDPRLANKIDCNFLRQALRKTVYKYDVILIDTNHAMDSVKLVALDESDKVVFVLSNDPMDLKNMKTMVSIFKDMEKDNFKILMNDAKDRQRNYFENSDIKNIIKNNIDYTIPSSFYIKTIDKYVLDGKILTLDKKVRANYKKAIRNFELLANSLLKEKKKKEE